MDDAEMEWDFNVKHITALRTTKAKKAMTKRQTFVMDGHEKADELVEEGAGAWWQMAAARALTIRQLREVIDASIWYAARFHVEGQI